MKSRIISPTAQSFPRLFSVKWEFLSFFDVIQTNNSQLICHREQVHHFKCRKYLWNHLCRENKWKRRKRQTNGDYLPLAMNAIHLIGGIWWDTTLIKYETVMTCNEEIIMNFLPYYCEHSEQINVVNSYLSFDYDKLHISGFSLFRTDKIPGFFQSFPGALPFFMVFQISVGTLNYATHHVT